MKKKVLVAVLGLMSVSACAEFATNEHIIDPENERMQRINEKILLERNKIKNALLSRKVHRFDVSDLNKDGLLSEDEMKTINEYGYTVKDSNQDGLISLEEFKISTLNIKPLR